MKWSRVWLLLVVAIRTGAAPCLAVDRYVAFGGSNTAPYTNWTTAASNIQAAVDASSAGDTVWVSNGVYVSTGPVTNGAMISITKAITLKSVYGAAATVIAGGYPAVTNRCLYLSHASAVVEGFTLRDGYATGAAPLDKGGGVYISANGTLRNSLIILNAAAADGAGVYVATNGTVESCTISTNIAVGNGGGVFVATAATLRNNILYFNAAGGSVNYSGGTHTYSCATPLPGGTGNTASDPLFVDAANTNFHIQAGSPCINACPNDSTASWAYNLARDLDGQDRIIGGMPDMGVDEFTRYYYVAPSGNNSNPGTPASPWLTIQYAVTNTAVTNGDTIVIGEGLYVENVNFPTTGRSGLTLIGGYNTNDWTWAPVAHPTIIKATSTANDVITWSTAPQTLMSVTLTGGNRGIYNGTSLNYTRYTVAGCIISNNAAEGIRINGSKCALFTMNSLIVRNGSDGISFVVDNAAYGSPIYNCTIADNTGNGIFMNYNVVGVDIRNCVIARNAKWGVQQNPASGHQPLNMSYSTVYGNTLGDFRAQGETLRSQSQRLYAGAGMMTADPRFVGSSDYHLSNASPCIDSGANLTALGVTSDLETAPRPVPYDLGCYESVYAAVTRNPTTYVDGTVADETGDGTSWTTAKKTIGSGLALTAPNGVCQVAAGSYRENLFIPATVTLSSTNRELTIVYNTGTWHVVTFAEGPARIQRFTISGGIRGVDIVAQSNTVEDCVLVNNKYGLAYIRMLSVINNCIVTNNAYHGTYGINPGAIGMHNPALVARNCLIARNGNSGCYLGWDNGGGDHVYWMNCTIVSNGLHGYEANTYNSMAYITNTILAGNNGYGTYISTWGAAKQYLDYSCVFGNTSGAHYNNTQVPVLGANMIGSDPKLDANSRLTSSSPCIDAGYNLTAAGVTNDVDGAARTNTFDIGCYESAFPPPPKYNVVYVDSTSGDDGGDGTNWITAKKTIGTGFSVLTPTGTCYLASGLYNEGVSIPANVTLAGTNRDTTVISNSGSVVSMASTNSRLREVTVAGGTYGIAMSGVRNFAQRCVLRNNANSGVNFTATSNQVSDSVIHNNLYGVRGPGVSIVYTLDRCVIASNTSHGIYQTGGGSSSPGGLILNSLIIRNGGDGFRSETDNGIYSTYFYNSTIADNTGNGIYDNYLTRTPYVRNCILFGNLYGINQADNGHFSFYVTSSCLFSNRVANLRDRLTAPTLVLQSGNFTADPLFVGNGDYHLRTNSPCIGYGTTNGLLTLCATDLDGVSRSLPFDMGCYASTTPPVARSLATFVNGTNGNDAAAGTSWGTAKKTIGSALALTVTNGTCYVAPGTYSDTIILPALVTVEGLDRDTTIVTSSWNVACLPETNSVVRGLTLQNGRNGVYQSGKFGTVDQCILRQNNVGMYVSGIIYQGWNALVSRTIAISNASHGLSVSQSGVTARNSLFARNGGDGVYISSDNPQVYSFMDFCTFADNSGSGYTDWHDSHWRTALTNCIATGNAVNGIRFKRLNNDVIAYSCVYSNAGGDFSGTQITIGLGMVTNQPPQFFKATYTLAEDSPCLDSGINIGVTNDIRGFARPIIARKPPAGSGYDMGCYETIPPTRGAVFVIH